MTVLSNPFSRKPAVTAINTFPVEQGTWSRTRYSNYLPGDMSGRLYNPVVSRIYYFIIIKMNGDE